VCCGYHVTDAGDREHFPDGEELVASFRDGTNPYGAVVRTLNNHHPNGYVIKPSGEDRYADFAKAMGADPAQNASFACDFYNRTYVVALQTTMLAGVEDFPWIDCMSCSVHGDCGNHPGAPANLDFNLLANYAFDAQFELQNQRSLTLNRLPGRGDGSNYNDAPLNGSKLQTNLRFSQFSVFRSIWKQSSQSDLESSAFSSIWNLVFQLQVCVSVHLKPGCTCNSPGACTNAGKNRPVYHQSAPSVRTLASAPV
jgi:hypothetical protein